MSQYVSKENLQYNIIKTKEYVNDAIGTKQDTLVNQENIKSINGDSILGSGDLSISTYQAFPSSWSSSLTGTTSNFCSIVNADSSAIEGMSYLGEVRWSDLPSSLVNAEVVVEIMSGSGTSGKVIHLVLTSGNRNPYRWEYTYWNNGSNTSGWIGFQPKLTAGTNITISGDTISATDTTYSSLSAENGGTDVSLVTTGEKYIWNNKQNIIIQDLTANSVGTLNSTEWGNLKTSHYAIISNPTMTGLSNDYEFVNIKLNINNINQFVKLVKNTTNKYSGLFFIEEIIGEIENLYEINISYNGIDIILKCDSVYLNRFIPYLTFSSPDSFTIGIVDNQKYCDGTLEYSTDKNNWNAWDCTSPISSVSDGTKHNIYMRGTGNTYITGYQASSTTGHFVLTGSNISCEGNIETLLDYQTVVNGNHPTIADYCFTALFYNCNSLIKAPSLPTITLTEGCYAEMFGFCTSLVAAPSLPATTLSESCYMWMFASCYNLQTVPNLPATTLFYDCYTSMFNGCTSLYVSDTQTAETTYEWRIPTNSVMEGTTYEQLSTFSYCLGVRSDDDFAGTSGSQFIYYTQNQPV